MHYYHFDKDDLSRKPIITKYFEVDEKLEGKFTIANRPIKILDKEKIKEAFYIEIVDININENDIRIELKIEEEGIKSGIYLEKNKEGNWFIVRNHIWEN